MESNLVRKQKKGKISIPSQHKCKEVSYRAENNKSISVQKHKKENGDKKTAKKHDEENIYSVIMTRITNKSSKTDKITDQK